MIAALFFYLFAGICVASAFLVIAARNPVHSVLYLILAFVNASGLFVMMGAEFLAMILIVVYVGAVAVLFLFVVMMLDVDLAALRAGFIRYLPVGIAVAVLMAAELALVVGPRYFGLGQYAAPVPKPAGHSNTEVLGEALYTTYLYPFEIAAAILLVAIIAAIGLTLRRRPDTKYLDPSRQVFVKRDGRVTLVKMAPEKKLEIK